MFEEARKLGHEGIVSKHRNSIYRAGRSSNWIKVKNPASPAMRRSAEINQMRASGVRGDQ